MFFKTIKNRIMHYNCIQGIGQLVISIFVSVISFTYLIPSSLNCVIESLFPLLLHSMLIFLLCMAGGSRNGYFSLPSQSPQVWTVLTLILCSRMELKIKRCYIMDRNCPNRRSGIF